MNDKRLEAIAIREAVESVPFARGEDRDARIVRVAAHLGVSRSTVYNWLNPDHPARIPLNALLWLLDLVDINRRAAILARLCNVAGVRVEGNP
jgi:predicted DNA-binding transcriptional regulator AlpA